MGAFDLPEDHWKCKACGRDWYEEFDEDEKPECTYCGSTDVEKKNRRNIDKKQ